MVSVVVNTYRNAPSRLFEAVQSYRNQEGIEVEIIVSTVVGDSSIGYAQKLNLKTVISNQPGIYSQLNKAIKAVEGEWYVYASGNDFVLPTKLKDEIACCGNTHSVCYSDFYVGNGDLSIQSTTRLPDYNHASHFKNNFVSDVALVRTSLLKKYAPFREQFQNKAYWDFWLRIAKGEGTKVFVHNPKPEWIYRVTEESRSRQRHKSKELCAAEAQVRREMLKAHGH